MFLTGHTDTRKRNLTKAHCTDYVDSCSHGKKVICYFSAGSHEDWRADVGSVASDDLGLQLDNWPGERWWNITCTIDT